MEIFEVNSVFEEQQFPKHDLLRFSLHLVVFGEYHKFSFVSDGQNLSLFSNRPQPKKKRKSRTAFTNHQIFELEKRFLYQKYLSPADRDEIASSLGLTNAQVITWFQNRRAKLKRDMEELKKEVHSANILSVHKSFLENVQDIGMLKKKSNVYEDSRANSSINS